MNITEISTFLSAAKTALDIFRSVRDELPQGASRDNALEQIERAERALKASEAELAKALGYKICHCNFPPSIMLWKEAEKAHICPNPSCGHTINAFPNIITTSPNSWTNARRGQ